MWPSFPIISHDNAWLIAKGRVAVAMLGIIKGIKNGCPGIVEIRGTQGCALVGAVGECRDVTKSQP